ncbi:MAG: alpha-mannosidase, partial [Clostridia bacterium]|nr:alpha-mannosidase [Clostridia bacterium]
IINDCKYGYDIHNSHMRITLMRAPTCPDRTGDHGINTFKYAFYPHEGDWRCGTVQQALAFNIPPVGVYNAEDTNGILAGETQFINVSDEDLVIDAFKKAQDGRGYIIRIVEDEQKRGRRSISFGFEFSKVIECNMIEEDKAEIAFEGNTVEFDIKPFEVKTFRII